MQHPKQAAKEAAEKIGEKVEKEGGEKLSHISQEALSKYKSIKDVLGVNEESMEALYSQAYLLYNTGRYKDSSEVFRLLIMFDSTQAKYLMGLAACLHMQKEYLAASAIYQMTSLADPSDPIPFFHASDCYLHLQDKVSAAVALEMALKRAEGKPEFSALKERATITLQAVRKELLTQPAAKGG